MYNKNCIYIYKQNYAIINQNQKKDILLEAKSWNGLKRSYDDGLKK